MIVVQAVFFLLNLAAVLLLINVCCPNPHLRLKGKQRKENLGIARIPFLADEAPGGIFVMLLSLVVFLVFTCLHFLAVSSEQVNSVSSSMDAIFLPGLFFLCTSLGLRAARELWFNLGFWGFVGFVWITPMLACLVLAVDDFLGNSQLMLYLSSLSPLTFFPQLITFLSPTILEGVTKIANFSGPVKIGIITAILVAFALHLSLFLSNKK